MPFVRSFIYEALHFVSCVYWVEIVPGHSILHHFVHSVFYLFAIFSLLLQFRFSYFSSFFSQPCTLTCSKSTFRNRWEGKKKEIKKKTKRCAHKEWLEKENKLTGRIGSNEWMVMIMVRLMNLMLSIETSKHTTPKHFQMQCFFCFTKFFPIAIWQL